MATIPALTVRLPAPVYKAARRLAEREGISLNRLVPEAIAEKAHRATRARLKHAYDLLGEDTEEADVERLLGVQAEAPP